MPQTKNRTKNPEIVSVCDKSTDPLLVQFQMLAEKKTAQGEDAKFWEFSYQPESYDHFFLTEHLTHKPHFQSLRAHPS